MRLTLRTMLAWLDDCLSKEDAAVLGEKVQASEFAGRLVQRIRNSMKRQRLGAPKIAGKGMGLDGNTVAEYIDGTLPEDRVPDFEKVCLESDVHLAEVAACHHILTVYFREPPEINNSLRERMYAIAAPALAETADGRNGEASSPPIPAAQPLNGNVEYAVAAMSMPENEEPAAADIESAAADGGGNAGEETPQEKQAGEKSHPVERAKHEVPDYLIATRKSRVLPIAMTVVVVFLITSLLLLVVWPFGGESPIAGLFGGPSTDAADVDSTDAVDVDATDNAGEDADAVSSDADEATSDAADVPSDADDAASDSADADVASDADSRPTPPADDGTADAGPVVPPATDGTVPPMPADDGTPPLPSDGGTPIPPVVPPVDPPAVPPIDPGPAVDPVIPPKVPGDLPPVGVGRFTSEDQVIARLTKVPVGDTKETSDEWMRVPANSAVTSNDRLLVLPTYRPPILLASGLEFKPLGGTSVVMLPPLAGGVPAVRIEYGKALIVTPGRAGAQIALDLNGRSGVAVLEEAASTIAVEVNRYLPPGVDPIPVGDAPSPVVSIVQIFADKGRVLWKEADMPTTINAGQVLVLIGKGTGRTEDVVELPTWLNDEGIRPIDRDASRDLESYLATDRPIGIKLVELLEEFPPQRRIELRSLAARSLAYMEYYEPFVVHLNNAFQKSYWDDAFDTLRESLSRGPKSAAAIKVSFDRHRLDDSAQLMNLVRGYSVAQLAAGGADELVEGLKSEEMDVRVLSYENLRRITERSHFYLPHLEPSSPGNVRAIKKWEQDRDEKLITYRLPPSPLPKREESKPPIPDKPDIGDTPEPPAPAPIPVPAPTEPAKPAEPRDF